MTTEITFNDLNTKFVFEVLTSSVSMFDSALQSAKEDNLRDMIQTLIEVNYLSSSLVDIHKINWVDLKKALFLWRLKS